MTDKVRWAVLGTAKIAREKVIPAMQESEWSEVVAIASRDLASARGTASALGIPRAYGAYEEVLSDPDIDAVYIPLPNHLHVPWAIRCVEAGKHVLCEKPVAMSVDECRSLIAARDAMGVKVGEAFAVFTHPQWRRVYELVRSGEIGELRAVVASFGFFLEDSGNVRNVLEFGGGAIMDIGCYPIKLARWLFGEEPISVSAVLECDPHTQVDVMSSVVLGFAGGQCSFTCSIQQVNQQSVQILGTKARIEVPVPFNPHPRKKSRLMVDDGSDLWGSGARVEEFEACDHYTIQGDEFSRAVRGFGEVPTALEDSVRNMAVIEAVFESARTGMVQKLG